MPLDELYTYADLARLTGRSVGTIRQWAKRGKLPPPDYKIGQSPAWSPESIDDWLGYRQLANDPGDSASSRTASGR